MKSTTLFIYLVAAGLVIIALNFLGRIIYTRLLKPLPGAAVRLGKAWGETTDRYRLLRALNSFFYIIGMAATLAGIIYGGTLLTQKTLSPAAPAAEQPAYTFDDRLDPLEILNLVNAEREAAGLNKLNADGRLMHIAEVRAQDMSVNEYYSHLSPKGEYYYDLFPEYEIAVDYSCENLNVEFTLDESKYVQTWLASNKGHRECMLHEDVTSAGYAVSTFGDPATSDVYMVVAIHTSSIEIVESETKPKPKPASRSQD